jgi:hypothetical protein
MSSPRTPFGAAAKAVPPKTALCIFNLPRNIRDCIYRHVLHGGLPINRDWEASLAPYLPKENFGLLYTSRQIYQEASAILYESVHVGSDPIRVWNFLDFIGQTRIQQIQNLGLYYHCADQCRSSQHYGAGSLDWMPVFELLCSSGASMRYVDVYYWPCMSPYSRENYLDTQCRLEWDAEVDFFWPGLQTLTVAREIRLIDETPEYYVHRMAKYLGWEMHGKIKGGYEDPRYALSTFSGKLVNPFVGGGRAVASGPFKLLDLPLEIRCKIYDYASEWTYKPFWPARPARWNTGTGLLGTSKQIACEATPSVYHSLRIHGGLPLEMIDRFGTNLAHVQTIEVQFTCFCPLGGPGLRHNNAGLFATRGVAVDEGFRLQQDYVSDETVQKVKDTWTEAIHRIQTSRGLAELAVTFQSCCRSASYQPRWYLEMDMEGFMIRREPPDHSRIRCLEVESHFSDLIAGSNCSHRADTITLLGNAPPSLAVRMAQPYPGCGLSVTSINKQLAQFIAKAEMDRQEWERRVEKGRNVDWEQMNAFPGKPDPSTVNREPSFVLTRYGSIRNNWIRQTCPEEASRLEPGVERVVGSISRRAWTDLREFLDCDGQISEQI